MYPPSYHKSYEKLLAAVTEGETLTVDLAEVAAFDTAGVQLLVALVRAAEGRGGTIAFTNPSEDLNKAVQNMDLVKYLGKWPSAKLVDGVSA